MCTGNICRSPTGERLAAAYAAELGIPDFVASSAGTRAVIGHPIHEKAAVVLEELGGDPSDFTARQLSEKLASKADLVLAMTRGHRDKVLGIAPRLLKRTFTLAEAAAIAAHPDAATIADLPLLRPRTPTQQLADVQDPIGLDAAVFESVGAQIATLLPPVMKLCARSSSD
ncbi:low molecular weight phosphatase family protein [Mycolicibacterium tokaiense]|uniref:protein-tyrosine-phosphatase n=1 Tax=Mycolicibacterium tokaiense TaxID=39695 RepID=A0A378TE32_9MYCO|nr:protein-tyrosine-phosphatase [Mycolicibacterium tokaiense]STZ58135.1 protein-tyrosine-phosphatase [Mycolicibacterium tokaiense]